MLTAFVIVGVVIVAIALVVFYMGPETFLAKVFGTKHARDVKAMMPSRRGHQRFRATDGGADQRGTGWADRSFP